jgi:N-acetylmuramoyl-L-alanine amidase
VLPIAPVHAADTTGRYYKETGFRITNAAFLSYFDHRGGLRTFGYPVSREFTLYGFRVQFFQRAIMQQNKDGSVTTMNFMDAGLMPYTQINQSTFPASDPNVISKAPQPGSPNYGTGILDYVKNTAPDAWNNLPVKFYQTFLNTVTANDAFPDGNGNTALLTGFDIELWGVPTSAPVADPKNANFIYQRFQRGVMHYDKTTGTTQGLLLADYVKSIITGENLPPDLDAAAKSSPLYKQYDASKANWVARPNDLPGTDLSGAFEPEATIVIDPGHGGKEVGASFKFADGTILREKDVNLTVANRVTAILKEGGYRVIQTRTTDTSVAAVNKNAASVDISADLQARIDIANNAKASLFFSIHFNGHPDANQRGSETYYNKRRTNSAQSLKLAQLVQKYMVSSINSAGYSTVDRGVKTDETSVGFGNSFYLLGPDADRPSTMPGALAEGLFMTNPGDAEKLRDSKILEAIAYGYAKAIMEYSGPAEAAAPAAPTPAPTAATPAATTPAATATPAPTAPASSTQKTYVVVKGDTMNSIAARNNTTVDAIAKANNIADPTKISVGQTLVIPAK